MSLIYSPSPWIQTFKQPTLSSVSLLSAFRYFPTDLSPISLPPALSSSSSPPGWGQIIAPAPTPRPAPSCAPDTASCGRASPSAGTGSRSSAPPGSGRRCWTPGAARKKKKHRQTRPWNLYSGWNATNMNQDTLPNCFADMHQFFFFKKKEQLGQGFRLLSCFPFWQISQLFNIFFPLLF